MTVNTGFMKHVNELLSFYFGLLVSILHENHHQALLQKKKKKPDRVASRLVSLNHFVSSSLCGKADPLGANRTSATTRVDAPLFWSS